MVLLDGCACRDFRRFGGLDPFRILSHKFGSNAEALGTRLAEARKLRSIALANSSFASEDVPELFGSSGR